MAEVVAIHPRVALGIVSVEAIAVDAERLQAVLAALGDIDGAARASLERAKLHFWAGQAQPGLELALAVLEQPITDPRLRDECRRWAAAFAFWGPMSADDAIALVTRLAGEIDDPRSFGALRLTRNLGGLLAMQGRFDEAREAFDNEMHAWLQFGDVVHAASLEAHFMAPMERHAGNLGRAIEVGRRGFETLIRIGAFGFANTAAAELSRSLFEHGDLAAAEQAATQALELAGADDPAAVPQALGVLARLAAGRGELAAAEQLARRGLEILVPVDHLDRKADAHMDLAEVLLAAGRRDEATAEMETALAVFDRKGHRVGAERTRQRLAELAGANH
jgi:ATP/maltotriose-dependent transcriptional regulator MalT